ncbi:MAG: hypothetical protein AB1758_37275 [Candidatus Eremiobacterota bacterium]
MNKHELLLRLVWEAEERGDDWFNAGELQDDLYYLNGQREIDVPPLPSDHQDRSVRIQRTVRILREYYEDDVALISRVLNELYPGDFLFYRCSSLEPHIFAGLAYLSEFEPLLDMEFDQIGRTGWDRYAAFNDRMLRFFETHFRIRRKPQSRLAYFLYEGLGRLFLPPRDYRYWVVSAPESFYRYLDRTGEDEPQEWSWLGNKWMRDGDLVFLYRQDPDQAIRDLLIVQDYPDFHPCNAGDGVAVRLGERFRMPPITLQRLRKDPVLSDWEPVKGGFAGVVAAPIPPRAFNRLLEVVPLDVQESLDLQPEPSESDYADQDELLARVLEPMCRRLELLYETRFGVWLDFGLGQRLKGQVDLLLRDGSGDLSLIQCFPGIPQEEFLEEAAHQALSYALLMGFPSFVVGAPEGLWVFEVAGNRHRLRLHLPAREVMEREQELKKLLLSLRPSSSAAR